MAIRQRITEYTADIKKLRLLRRAIERMKSRSDDRSYEFFAGIHGLPLPSFCVHGSRLFLPWHRAYLYYFELALQTRLGPNFTIIQPEDPQLADVGLPWWDWASDQAHTEGIPNAYAQPIVGGIENVLAVSEFGWPVDLIRTVRRHPRLRSTITRTGVAKTLRSPNRPEELPRQRSIDRIVQVQPTYGHYNDMLEQIHGDVHVWVGGSMREVPTAAYDPIFWSHHAMIDRLWHLWQNSNFGAHPPTSLRRQVLTPFPMTVEDTLDVESLGIEYAVSADIGG